MAGPSFLLFITTKPAKPQSYFWKCAAKMDDASRKQSAAIRDFETLEESTNPRKQCEGSEPMPSRQTKSNSPSNRVKDDDEPITRLVL